MKEISADKLIEYMNADSMKNAYMKIKPSDWDLSDVDVVSLCQPSKVDWRLRIRFWDLVDKVTGDNDYDMIYAVDVFDGICGASYFRSRFDKDYFPAFFFRPIEKYIDDANTMLTVTSSKMWALINSINPLKEDGTVNMKEAYLLRTIHNDLVERKMGAVKQLVEMKKVQLNVNAGLTMTDDIEMLDATIREMTPNVDISETKRLTDAETEEDGISL